MARRVSLTEAALDLLLFDFLNRLLYYKDAERLLLRATGVDVRPAAGGWSLDAALAGEPIDPARRALGVDVKAITMHRLSVGETGAGLARDGGPRRVSRPSIDELTAPLVACDPW